MTKVEALPPVAGVTDFAVTDDAGQALGEVRPFVRREQIDGQTKATTYWIAVDAGGRRVDRRDVDIWPRRRDAVAALVAWSKR